jgi:hypothetical protein
MNGGNQALKEARVPRCTPLIERDGDRFGLSVPFPVMAGTGHCADHPILPAESIRID